MQPDQTSDVASTELQEENANLAVSELAAHSLTQAERMLAIAVLASVVVLGFLYLEGDRYLEWCGARCISFAKDLIPNLVSTGLTFLLAYFVLRKLQELQTHRLHHAHLQRISSSVRNAARGAVNRMLKEQQVLELQRRLISLDEITESVLKTYTQIRDDDEDVRGILSIKYKYQDTRWDHLLSGATLVETCMYHASTFWFRDHAPTLQQFLNEGGELVVYLPDVNGVSDRFRGLSKFESSVVEKINYTASAFRQLARDDEQRSRIRIKSARAGFNYMFTRVTKADGALVLFSPYSNNHEKTDSPAILLDEERADPALRTFIDAEIRLLEGGDSLPDPVAERFIVWGPNQKKVFVSTMLECPAKCKFCYVESLADPSPHASPQQIAALITRELLNSPNFRKGPGGTVVMLGGFTDPFASRNVEASAYLIENLSRHGNWIHIATRYTVAPPLVDKIIPFERNIVLNYSISCLESEAFEIGNQAQRFAQAAEFSRRGAHVALFVRPVIKGVTLGVIDAIAQLAESAGMTVATVGGLYVDNDIESRLVAAGYTQAMPRGVVTKRFVLDKSGVLYKVENPEVQKVESRLRQLGFVVYSSADQRIEHFRALARTH